MNNKQIASELKLMEILIVEDEKALMDSMVQYLEMEGFKCIPAMDFKEGVDKINIHQYLCLLIDLNLPDGDGIDLVKLAKQNNQKQGTIIISARDAVEHRVEGLNAGADDYLVKPFHLSELAARVHSVIRRIQFKGNSIFEFGEIRIHPEERSCYIRGSQLELTNMEYELLLYFMSNRNRVITKESIADYLYREYSGGNASYEFVYTHLKNLRKKLSDAACPDYIRNIYGIGYKMTED